MRSWIVAGMLVVGCAGGPPSVVDGGGVCGPANAGIGTVALCPETAQKCTERFSESHCANVVQSDCAGGWQSCDVPCPSDPSECTDWYWCGARCGSTGVARCLDCPSWQ